MLDDRDQYIPRGLTQACVAQHEGHLAVEVERFADRLDGIAHGAVEAVDGDGEGDAAPLEVVDGREAVLQPSGVGQDDGAERALRQLVPQEPEAVLAGVPKR